MISEKVPIYRVNHVDTPITIDGRLDDPAWSKAEVIELLDCVTGGKPKYRTEARLLYDDRKLYVGFHSEDPEIWGTMTGHDDEIFNEEVVEIFIDPTGDLCCYYELEVSPLNVSFDALILNDAVLRGNSGRGDRFQGFTQWNPEGFEHAVFVKGELGARGQKKGEFWECEMAIDFADLFLGNRVPPKPGDLWRGNLYRIDIEGKQCEETAFSPTGLSDFHVPSRFGKLLFC
jgi:Carbohydrate family 9 binding domain-like